MIIDKETENKIILALDLGTKTGFAIYHNSKIQSGTKDFKATRFQSSDRRFFHFKKHLIDLLNKLGKIDIIYYEEVRRHIGTDASHIYGGFKATLSLFCEENNISYEGIAVGTIKKHLTGKGNASKSDMIEAVTKKGYTPIDDNEADAIGLLYLAIERELP